MVVLWLGVSTLAEGQAYKIAFPCEVSPLLKWYHFVKREYIRPTSDSSNKSSAEIGKITNLRDINTLTPKP